jgi:short-subunit dehydrogenase
LARELASRGARLTIIARPSAELDEVAGQTGAATLALDLADLDGLEATVARAEEIHGPLDALVNNAALVNPKPFAQLRKDEMRIQVFANLLAPMELARQALPGLLERGRGAILNVSSLSASVSLPNVSCYSVPKASLSKFTIDLQTELRASDVRAVLVALGAVGGTPMMRQLETDAHTAGIVQRFQAFKTATPEDVAARVADCLATERRDVLVVPRLATPLVSFTVGPMRLLSRLVAS